MDISMDISTWYTLKIHGFLKNPWILPWQKWIDPLPSMDRRDYLMDISMDISTWYTQKSMEFKKIHGYCHDGSGYIHFYSWIGEMTSWTYPWIYPLGTHKKSMDFWKIHCYCHDSSGYIHFLHTKIHGFLKDPWILHHENPWILKVWICPWIYPLLTHKNPWIFERSTDFAS